jgi:hypothetical protein
VRPAGAPVLDDKHLDTMFASCGFLIDLSSVHLKAIVAVMCHFLKVGVKLDGKCIGYTMAPLCESIKLGCSMVFQGFAHADPYSGNIAYRAFKFGALKPAAQAATVEHLDQIQAGRIEVTCEAVIATGSTTHTHRGSRWASDAAIKKLPEGGLICTLSVTYRLADTQQGLHSVQLYCGILCSHRA